MHYYIELIRNEIELRSEQEAYLASSLFWKLNQTLNYEQSQIFIKTKQDFIIVQDKVINALDSYIEFEITDEIIAWQVSILRDIVKYFYQVWENYLTPPTSNKSSWNYQKLECYDHELYLELSRGYQILTQLIINSNSALLEMKELWKLEHRLKNYRNNHFSQMRLQQEIHKSIIYKTIDSLEQTQKSCQEIVQQSSSANQILWNRMNDEFTALCKMLECFMGCYYNENPRQILDDWIKQIFPEYLFSGDLNPYRHGQLYEGINDRLVHVMHYLIAYTVHQHDPFLERDQIIKKQIKKFIYLIEFNNLEALQTTQIKKVFQK